MRLLDLFCGAGGAAMGYYRAGFDEIVGVDNRPMKRYPFTFVLGDALEYCRLHGAEFDAIHASPPCQRYSKCQKIRGYDHPDLIAATRDALQATGRPYVIENVPGAPLVNPTILYGTMFGLRVVRPRLFECSVPIAFELVAPPRVTYAKMGRIARDGEYIHVAGKGGTRGTNQQWKEAMGIDWMTIRELAQAIPPAYTCYIGRQLLAYLASVEAE